MDKIDEKRGEVVFQTLQTISDAAFVPYCASLSCQYSTEESRTFNYADPISLAGNTETAKPAYTP